VAGRRKMAALRYCFKALRERKTVPQDGDGPIFARDHCSKSVQP
jgi:hypothetical protein